MIYLLARVYWQQVIKFSTLIAIKKELIEALKEMKQPHIDDELFANESMLAVVNKVFDFNKFKEDQEAIIKKYNSKRQHKKNTEETFAGFKKPTKKNKR